MSNFEDTKQVQNDLGKNIEQQKHDLYRYVQTTNDPHYQIQYYVPKVINNDVDYVQHLKNVEDMFLTIHDQIQQLKQNYDSNPPIENQAKKEIELDELNLMIKKKSDALKNINDDIKELAQKKFED